VFLEQFLDAEILAIGNRRALQRAECIEVCSDAGHHGVELSINKPAPRQEADMES
jgi:hypothetical protein